MLHIVNRWCTKWRLLFNKDKTKIVHFRRLGAKKSIYKFKCGDIDLDFADSYKYLGIWLHEHLDMKKTINELSKAASRALGVIYTVL